MLGKLLKYEFKYMAKWLVPIYLCAVLLAPVTHFIALSDMFEGIFFFVPILVISSYIISLIAVSVGTTIIIIYRFYQNMTGEEGYLMHTLPVKTSTHLLCKTISGSVWMLLSTIITIVSIYIAAASSELTEGILMVSDAFVAEFGAGIGIAFLIEMIVIILISPLSNILLYYTSIVMGPVLLPKHRIVGGFLSYLIISTIMQVISTVLTVPIIFMGDMENASPTLVTNVVFPISIGLVVLSCIILYYISHRIMTKRLNLE